MTRLELFPYQFHPNYAGGGLLMQYPDGGGLIDLFNEYVYNPIADLFRNEGEKAYARVPESFNIQDNRKINPVTKKPINQKKDLKNYKNVQKEDVEAIIKAADFLKYPRDLALSVALQESGLGTIDENYGHNINYYYEPPNDATVFSGKEKQALDYISGLQDKANSAKKLAAQKKIPKANQIYQLQAYNGLGVITPATEQAYYNGKNKSFYGIDVTKKPLNLAKNPVYGKTIMNLRDSVVRLDPNLQKMLKVNPYYQDGGEIKNNVINLGYHPSYGNNLLLEIDEVPKRKIIKNI